jgi:hypothetical protein
VKLDAFREMPTMAQAHNFPIFSLGANLQAWGQGIPVYGQGVVAHGPKWLIDPGKYPLPIRTYCGNLAVHELFGPDNIASKSLGNSLMAKTDPKYRDPS